MGLVTNYGEGGATKWEGGGQVKFHPYEKWGVQKVLAMLKGGTKSFKVVLTRELEVLAILMGAAKGFHLLKVGGGGTTSYKPVSRGAQKVSDPRFSPFVAPPPLPPTPRN